MVLVFRSNIMSKLLWRSISTKQRKRFVLELPCRLVSELHGKDELLSVSCWAVHAVVWAVQLLGLQLRDVFFDSRIGNLYLLLLGFILKFVFKHCVLRMPCRILFPIASKQLRYLLCRLLSTSARISGLFELLRRTKFVRWCVKLPCRLPFWILYGAELLALSDWYIFSKHWGHELSHMFEL